METFAAAAHADGYEGSSISQAINTTSSAPVSSAWENLYPIDSRASRPRLSGRVKETEPAHIEAVLSKYARLSPQPANLAQGVAYWAPPPAALREIARQESAGLHKYGPALGLPSLRKALVGKLERENGLDITGQEVMVTAGGNQAFAMVALALLDPGDKALLV